MKKIITLLILAVGVTGCQTAGTPKLHANISSSPIYHEIRYPQGSGELQFGVRALAVGEQVPAVIVLHSSGGFGSVRRLIQRYVDDGFSVYAPVFFQDTVLLQERGWKRSALTEKILRRSYLKSSTL